MPAPGSYDISTASTSFGIIEPPPKKEKDKETNAQTDEEKKKTPKIIKTKGPTYKFSDTENKRFTTLVCEQKAFVPGAGYYDFEKCFNVKARPNSANRRRRV